jgi:hypothetical protein
MKNLYSSALRRIRISFAAHRLLHGVIHNVRLYFALLILIGFVFISCKKESANIPGDEIQSITNHAVNSEGDFLNNYGLSSQTTWELQQARAATARYKDINNAIKDGYSNINVDVPNMGHHFMNSSLVDGTFDIRKPEILVYSGVEEGNPELVAVEYATTYFADQAETIVTPRPEGFTGSGDVWKSYPETGFKLWLQHAWVWKYNPDGVFGWTNPLIEGD